jgi:predicted cobalt transporter CbtA
MAGDLLWRGMLAGILAALLATLFARAVAEPQIDLAIGYEESHAAHHPGAAPEEELVSRDTQKGFGLLTALALYGAAVGGVFSLVFAYGYGRFARIGPRSFALLLAGLAFLLIVVVQGIKYPQTPPAVGKHETVQLRTAAYFLMIALSLVSAVVAGKLRPMFARSLGAFDASLLAIGAYVLLVGLGQLVLPAIDEVPADFSAALLWNFRIASIATQLLLWSVIGILFGRWAAAVLDRAGG